MIKIYGIHLEGGTRHEHIAAVRWVEPATGKTGENTRAEMVDWINKGGEAFVEAPDGTRAWVGVVQANPPYLRTYADGIFNDNLLSLPPY